MKSKPAFSLKDELFNKAKVHYLADLMHKAYPSFNTKAFYEETLSPFPSLELKERITHICQCLHKYLPPDYVSALSILLDALPQELDPGMEDNDFGDFIFSPLSLYVATYGCDKANLTRSLMALKEITKRFSAEFSIRFFINTFPEETMAFLSDCAKDENYHVRRLASEGSRPKLPWAQKIHIPHQVPLEILTVLHSDPTRYVTRSVANHLNDISKIDPSLVIKTLKQWKKEKAQHEKELDFIIGHSLRTLVKQGNKDALKLLGFTGKPDIKLLRFNPLMSEVMIGEALEFELHFIGHKEQKLIIDYILEYASPHKKKSQKVFKLKQIDLTRDKEIRLLKKHPLRIMSTKVLYSGKHKITLQINGENFGQFEFNLIGL